MGWISGSLITKTQFSVIFSPLLHYIILSRQGSSELSVSYFHSSWLLCSSTSHILKAQCTVYAFTPTEVLGLEYF